MISRKLKDNSGASILLALLFFLLCALAGSVVLAAGSAAAGRMKDVNAKEQAYLSVISAAELLREEIDGKSISYDIVNKTCIQKPDSELDTLLAECLEQALEVKKRENPFSTFKEVELTIKPHDTDTAENMGTVTASIDMKVNDSEYADYTLIITLFLKNEENDPEYIYTLTVPAAELNDDGSGTGSSDDILTLVWSNAVITRGGTQ